MSAHKSEGRGPRPYIDALNRGGLSAAIELLQGGPSAQPIGDVPARTLSPEEAEVLERGQIEWLASAEERAAASCRGDVELMKAIALLFLVDTAVLTFIYALNL